MNNRMTSVLKHCLLILIIGLLSACDKTTQIQEAEITPEEARAIAKEAYIYGFPMVDSYRIYYSYFVDSTDPEFKAPWNQLRNTPRVYTHEDKTIQTPNSDTPYSALGFDLRAEPIVITVPVVEKSRYFSVQLVDAYTFNFAYIGSRATGNDGGSFLLAGPGWKGEKPKGIKKVFRSETNMGWAQYRTQLINPADLENVKKVQAGYNVETLSKFLGQPAPKAAPKIDFIKPLTPEQKNSFPEFFKVLNFALSYTGTHPSEKALMERFARLGIGSGKTFDAEKLSPEIRKAIDEGIADAWIDFKGLVQRINVGEVASGDIFGTREFMKNNYLNRMTAAVLGIFGNSKLEAMYPTYYIDSNGQKPDASKGNYTLHFTPGQLPPVNAFWSLTMYNMPDRLLVQNPLNRYLLNSPMLPDYKRDADGGVTLYIQRQSPGKEKEANWLPAPNGPFSMILRLYWPKIEAVDGAWKAPQLHKIN